MKIVLLGPPGSGKGTQAARLRERFGVEWIGVGDLLRAEVAAATDIGAEAADYMERGDLVPDDVIIRLVMPRVFAAADAGGYLLDGFPRTVEQADGVRAEAARRGATPDAAIYLDVARDELVRRILARGSVEGRADDTEDAVTNRLQVFDEQTRPLIAFYRERGLLRVVDANRAVDAVTDAVLDALGVGRA